MINLQFKKKCYSIEFFNKFYFQLKTVSAMSRTPSTTQCRAPRRPFSGWRGAGVGNVSPPRLAPTSELSDWRTRHKARATLCFAATHTHTHFSPSIRQVRFAGARVTSLIHPSVLSSRGSKRGSVEALCAPGAGGRGGCAWLAAAERKRERIYIHTYIRTRTPVEGFVCAPGSYISERALPK